MAKGNCSHYNKILKRVTNRIWDSLPDRERDIVAADVEQETAIAKWFNNTILLETKTKFESLTYRHNNQFSFSHSQREDNQNEQED